MSDQSTESNKISTSTTTGTTLGGTTLGGTTLGGTMLGGSSTTGITNSTGSTGGSSKSAAKNKKKKNKEKEKKEEQQNIALMMKDDNGDIGSANRSFMPTSNNEDEGIKDYKYGGYHPVKRNDLYNNGRYQVIDKLGWGHFSTVWLCNDKQSGKQVALKIVRSARTYSETAEDEIKILTVISKHNPQGKCIARLVDSFTHRGPNGRHYCMVFELLGNNLLDLIKHHRYRGMPMTLVKSLMKQTLIALDYIHTKCKIIHTDLKPENVLLELPFDFFTSNDYVWSEQYGFYKNRTSSSSNSKNTTSTTTTSNGNTGSKNQTNQSDSDFSDSDSDSSDSSSFRDSDNRDKRSINQKNKSDRNINNKNNKDDKDNKDSNKDNNKDNNDNKEKDNNSNNDNDNNNNNNENNDNINNNENLEEKKEFKFENGTSYKSKIDNQLFNENHYPKAQLVDLGNGCYIDRHFTDDIQTRQYRAPEAIVKAKWSTPVDIWSAACMAFELATGDHLFKPKTGKGFDKSDDHLALMIELLGKPPKLIYASGEDSKIYFNHKGDLRKIPRLSEQWPLLNVLVEKYKFSRQEAKEFESFLLPMLNYLPDKRATAKDCLQHPWLSNVPPYI